MKVKTVADLKRLPIGTRMILTQRRGEAVRLARVISSRTARSLGFRGETIADNQESWVNYPKASEFKATENGFQILDVNGDALLEYELDNSSDIV